MDTFAVVLEKPEQLSLQRVALTPPTETDVVVEIEWSGISTGTERLLYSGRMPHFPGMGYPLVPGYESVGRIIEAGNASMHVVGQRVFVPGARCFGDLRGLFGGAASRLVVSGTRVTAVPERLGQDSILLALAATAYHAIAFEHAIAPQLIVGHGVLGRLLARITLALGHPAPTVWELNPLRALGAVGYQVIQPDADSKRDYQSIYDVSGDASILDSLISRLASRAEVVLAGFYTDPLAFSFAPAFMRESRIRVAAEWRDDDLPAVLRLIDADQLSLAGLITHEFDARQAEQAYHIAFSDPSCLKMVLDWGQVQR